MEESLSFTPGPWSVMRDRSYCNTLPTIGIQSEQGVLAEVYLDDPSGDMNARLIALAPELLLIAKAYRNLLRTSAHSDGEVATYHHIESLLTKIERRS